MRKAGTDTVIHAEFEAGTEMTRVCPAWGKFETCG